MKFFGAAVTAALLAPYGAHGLLLRGQTSDRALVLFQDPKKVPDAALPAETEELLSCQEVLATHRKARGSPAAWLDTYERFLWALGDKVADAEKVATAAIKTLEVACRQSVDLDFATELGQCAVDGAKNPALFAVVQKGFAKVLQLPVLWNLFLPAEDLHGLCKVVNANGDNILHMAVRSRSRDVYEAVMNHITSEVEISTLKPLLEQRNAQNERALDTALAIGAPSDVVDALKAQFRALHLSIETSADAADEAQEDDDSGI